MLLPTQGARNEHVESLHKTKSAQLGLVPCFPSPKKVVRRLKFIPSALLLSSLRYRFAIAFSGSLSDSFSPVPRVHFSRQANKERRSRRFKSCDMDSLVRWSTHDLLFRLIAKTLHPLCLGFLPQTARSPARMTAMKLPGFSVDSTPLWKIRG